MMIPLMCWVTIMLTSTIMLLSTILSKKMIKDREKNSPFECGFDPKSSSRTPFSSQFFLIALIFLIFDVEIAILLPMPVTMELSNHQSWLITSSTFIIILLVGLIHEWHQGSLTWIK